MTQPDHDNHNSSSPPARVSDLAPSSPAAADTEADPAPLEPRALRPSAEYDPPASYRDLDDVCDQPPVQRLDKESPGRRLSSEDEYRHGARPGDGGGSDRSASLRQVPTWGSQASPPSRARRRRSSAAGGAYDVPGAYANLGEVAAVSPAEYPDEDAVHKHESLEEGRRLEQGYDEQQMLQSKTSPVAARRGVPPAPEAESPPAQQEQRLQGKDEGGDGEGPAATSKVSRLATQVYTISYLVLFSILGTLARLGLQALTTYPGTPAIFPSLWPNFGGSLFMGFLSEDRMLFRHEWGTPTYERQLLKARDVEDARGSGSERPGTDAEARGAAGPAAAVEVDLAAAKKAYMATKKTIPLYIGLATGFCGSFTSFSSFIRDVFLALSNDMPTPDVDGVTPRDGGYSFLALLAVGIVTVSASLAGLFAGAHLALALEPLTPSLPYLFTRKVLDRLAVLLGWGCWLGAVLLSALPPDRSSSGAETWRGRATFALVFAPLGCLARFYASLHLNGLVAAFPVGTFAVNVAGTGVLGMCWDLAHAPLGGVVGCQVLQGVEDGFCGCLTTVSTWVSELAALRRRDAYTYGGVTVLSGLAVMVLIMGGMRWSDGFAPLQCTH